MLNAGSSRSGSRLGFALYQNRDASLYRFAYVLLKPLRVFVTVKLPSARAEILIQCAGVCA